MDVVQGNLHLMLAQAVTMRLEQEVFMSKVENTSYRIPFPEVTGPFLHEYFITIWKCTWCCFAGGIAPFRRQIKEVNGTTDENGRSKTEQQSLVRGYTCQQKERESSSENKPANEGASNPFIHAAKIRSSELSSDILSYLHPMLGFRFSEYTPDPNQTTFDKLFDIFKELITHTSGDVDEALDWLQKLDDQYNLTDEDYTMDDFIEDLKKRGYIKDDKDNPEGGGTAITAKTEQAIRKSALDQIFGNIKKSAAGNHKIKATGKGDELSSDHRPFQYGDTLDQINMFDSIKNAQKNNIGGDFSMTEDDLVVREQFFKAQMSTVLMIDISHSMILYGEDRITPAKKVAMALAELITTRYPKDTLDVIVFGDDSWQIEIRDLPYLQVGPYHTNTVAGLDLAMDLLRRKKHSNKQIFMITDGKPSCLKEPDGYYKNSWGLDDYIVGKCLNKAAALRRLNIPITTFMIARDPYLQEFVQKFTEANQGKAFYTGLRGLGQLVFEDYERNRRKKI